MDMNKEFEAFSIAFDNGINDNKFVDSDNGIISESESQEILNLEERYRNERGMTESETSNITSSRISETHCGIFKDSKMQKSLAFTLSESLIMMAIVGVIAVITLVSLSGLKPNKDKMLLQKAHRATLEAVAEIANDTVAYPPLQSADLGYRERLLFAMRKQVQLALITPDLTQAITNSNIDCELPGRPGGGGGFTNTGLQKTFMCYKEDANGNPIEYTNSEGLIEFVMTTDCPKKNTLTLTIRTDLDPVTSTGGGWNLNPDLTLHPTNNINGHTDSVLPNIGSAGETRASGNVTITHASAVLTDRTIPTRDKGKYTATNKFAYLFAHVMQPSGKDISCSNNVCTFKTADGMDWTVTDGFSANNVNSTATILVDINGDKKPNKAYNPSNPNEVKTPDQFTFTVRANGQVTVPANDAVAQKYLQSRK